MFFPMPDLFPNVDLNYTTVTPISLEDSPRGQSGMAHQLNRVEFTGLIKNRSLRGLSQQEIRNAMGKAGLREAHNGHFIMRLIARGPDSGINTLEDFAHALNDGLRQAGDQMGTTEVVLRSGRAKVVLNAAGEFITFTHIRR